MRDRGEFRSRVSRARRLERYGARKDSPVDLRQRDMHREIRRPKAALRGAPRLEVDPGQHDLQDRRIEAVERRSLLCIQTRGKGGGVEYDVEALPIEKGVQAFERRLVLEAGHEHARDREPLVAERVGQRFDRLKIVGEIDGAIEDDEGARCALAGLANRQRRSGRRR